MRKRKGQFYELRDGSGILYEIPLLLAGFAILSGVLLPAGYY